MNRAAILVIALCVALGGQTQRRELVYSGAVLLGGDVMPRYDSGFLMYLHRPNRLRVFGPQGQLVFDVGISCPDGPSQCSATSVAATPQGTFAVGLGLSTRNGFASGIRLIDISGKEVRYIETQGYVPRQLAFDRNGDLWTMGWQRDSVVNDRESTESYSAVRKYSTADGKLLGEYLPRSMWKSKHGPALGAHGYWTMSAGGDRIGALFNENHADGTAEWIEWDLKGTVLSRTPIPEESNLRGRAFGADGRLYAQFPELKVLDTKQGKWLPARTDLPRDARAFLLGADEHGLVFRLAQSGNVHLVWAKPE